MCDKYWWQLVAIILLIHLVCCVHAAALWSPTHDEYWHLPVGLLHYQTGEFKHDVLNPPIVRLISALPVYYCLNKSLDVIPGTDPARHGDAFMAAYRNDTRWGFFLGRLMNILLSLLLGYLLARFTRGLAGSVAGIMVLFLYCTNPNIIAHASLVTTDLGAALVFFLVFLATLQMSKQQSLYSACILGVMLGIAQGTKFTSLILIPLSCLSYCIWSYYLTKNNLVTGDSTQQKSYIYSLMLWTMTLFAMIIVINLCYLGQSLGTPLGQLGISSQKLTSLMSWLPGISQLPLPLPVDYVRGIDQQLTIMEGQHPVFFVEWYDHGFFSFYLLNIIFKNPLVYLILTATGLYSLCRGNSAKSPELLIICTGLCWGLALFLIASFSNMQLGIRYILPVYPFMLLLIGLNFKGWSQSPVEDKTPALIDATHEVASSLAAKPQTSPASHQVAKKVITLTIVLSGMLTLLHQPHQLSYTNILAGSTWDGYLTFGDSNYDWGQDLYSLRDYYQDQKIEKIYMAYFGTYPVEQLGINYELPPDLAPKPGWYAISANLLTGRHYPLRKPDGTRDSSIPDRYFYMRYFKPVIRTGPSIFVYHLTESDVARWQHDMQQIYQQR